MTQFNQNYKELIGGEITQALECVSSIRELVEHAGPLNAMESSQLYLVLEGFVEKFKLSTISVSVESLTATSLPMKYCNSIITSLESRLEKLAIL